MSGGVLELEGVRAWPRPGAAPEALPAEPGVLPSYHEPSLDGMAARCAEQLSAWGVSDDGEKTAAAPASLWKDQAAHPVVLTLMLLDRYGPEYLEWDPEVLRVTLQRDATQVSNQVFTKILAARVALMSPSPWRQWDVFHAVTRGLNGVQPNFVFLEVPEIGHMMHGVDVMHLVDPKRVTSGEVDKFVAAALKNDGNVFAPAPLDFCRKELENPQLECGKCQALHRDDNDVRCISCGSTVLKKMPYEFADLKKKCEDLWSARVNLPLERAVDGLPTDAAGNLVYHLLVPWDYARRMRQLLLRQLRALA